MKVGFDNHHLAYPEELDLESDRNERDMGGFEGHRAKPSIRKAGVGAPRIAWHGDSKQT